MDLNKKKGRRKIKEKGKAKVAQEESRRQETMKAVLRTPPVRLSVPPLRIARFLNVFALPPAPLPVLPRLNTLLTCSPPRRLLFAPFSPPIAMASSASSSSSQMSAPGEATEISDVFEQIRVHQEAAARLSPVEEIRTLLDLSVRGVLSTFSQDHEGYPSGSMVDFACDNDGSPILAVSSLAVHSKNLLANPKCSLLVAKDPEDRTDIIVTLYGDAIPVSADDRESARAAYLRRHPDAFWVDFGDFSFLHIRPKYVRYVSGIATALLGSGVIDGEEYKAARVDPIAQFSKPVTSHMNRDHAEDTKAIVQHSTSVKVDFAHMLDLDSLGFNVKVGYQGSTLKLRIPFPRPAQDRKDVKTLIVEMLQAAKSEEQP